MMDFEPLKITSDLTVNKCSDKHFATQINGQDNVDKYLY